MPRQLIREELAIQESRQCTFIVTVRRVRAILSNTYSEDVSVALGIQRAMCMRHFVMCGLPGFNVVAVGKQY
jgi:hypothetical protein